MSDIPRLANSCYKQDLPKSKKQREKETNKSKGIQAEEKAIDSYCELLGRKRTKQDRRNNQATPWGGISNPDIQVKGLEGWHIEVKDVEKLGVLKTWDEHVKSTPLGKRPQLNFFYKGRELTLQYKEDLPNMAQDLVLASGFNIV